MADNNRKQEAAAGRARKRSRREQDRAEKLEQYGVDLPEIPGLPVVVIPLHVFALKQTVVSIKQDYKDKVLAPPSSLESDDEDGEFIIPCRKNAQRQNRGSLMESLVTRVEQAAGTAIDDTGRAIFEQQAKRQRQINRNDSIQSWLDCIQKEIRNFSKKHVSDYKAKIPIAAMKNLWDSANQHNRIHVRRAALFMSGHLLQKSSDARRWLLEEESTELCKWLDVLVAAATCHQGVGSSEHNNEQATRLWQCEGYQWMKSLYQESAFGSLYPRLSVAMQRIQQQCPWVLDSDDFESSLLRLQAHNMHTWRSLRNLATQHFEQEEQRVYRLLKRCSACFDVLAPRVVDHENIATTEPKAPDDKDETKQNTKIEEEDDDVDWEDGWEGKDGDISDNQDKDFHADAVERTLAAMQATAGKIQDGQLEIDMNATRSTADSRNVQDSDEMCLARQLLSKSINILQERHLPRLTQWMEGLTKADALVEASHGDGALVQMKDEQQHQRRQALETVMNLKSLVTSMLSSAKRLCASPETAATRTLAAETTQTEERRLECSSHNNNLNLVSVAPMSARAVLPSRQINKTRHAGYIRIKYRSG